MKKRLLAILATGVALSAGVTTAFLVGSNGHAANAEETGVLNNSGSACVFIDEDGDGVCDNKGNGNGNGGKNFVDADGDGVCDNKGSGQGCGNGGNGNCGQGNGKGGNGGKHGNGSRGGCGR